MKARRMLAGIWAVAMLLSGLGIIGLMTVPVVAQPQVHFFSGSITIDGLNAPDGANVYAEIDGTLYGQDSDQVGGGYDAGASVYSMAVSGEDDANQSAKEGGLNGETVVFWVQAFGNLYVANQAPPFQAGGITSLDLIIDTAGQPPRVRLFQIAPADSVSDWVELYNPHATTTVDLSQGWSVQDNYGGNWPFGPTDTLPPQSFSQAPHPVNLRDADGNVKLVWQDPGGIVAGGNPIVMDKAEWGPHATDSQTTGGDTIGLDKGDGSVWDPNLPNCGADLGYNRTSPDLDQDIADDWNHTGVFCLPIEPVRQKPQLWPMGTLGYETDYLDPEIGDFSTLFTWKVWYADFDNDAPLSPPELYVWGQISGKTLGPFPMNFVGWKNLPDMYDHPTNGAFYEYSLNLEVGNDWCYNISVYDVRGYYNKTADICAPIVGDNLAPEIEWVLVNGFPSITVTPGTVVALSAKINDTAYGNSNIGGAEWSVLPPVWPGTPMTLPPLPSADVIATYMLDTTGWLGDYDICVRAWDVFNNTNETCQTTAHLTVQLVDLDYPRIFSPRVNYQPQVTVAPGALVTLTAVVDDTLWGNSNISGANYTVGYFAWASVQPMSANDSAFDSPNETVIATVDTTGWGDGSWDVCVYAWDVALNNNTERNCAQITIDGTPPTVRNVEINGIPIGPVNVLNGTVANLTATIDDSLTGNSNIAFANFTYGATNWTSSINMNGAYISPIVDVWYEITTGVDPYWEGLHELCVYGSDVPGNDNTMGSCLQMNIYGVGETEPPEISNLLANGLPSATVEQGTSFTFTGIVDDSNTGNSNIVNASYIVKDASMSTVAFDIINASDGVFDTPTENVEASIDTTGWALGTYTVHIYACDAYNNCNDTLAASATVDIVTLILDDVPPEILNVDADLKVFVEGEQPTINLTATVDDSRTNGSSIASANYTIGYQSWATSVPMYPTDGAFDEVIENVNVTIDVSGWSFGTYTIFVYGSDAKGNDNTTSIANVTIEVQSAVPPDTTPPTVSDVVAEPSEVKKGGTVTISVTVQDETTSADNLDVEIRIIGPGMDTTADMTHVGGGQFQYTTPALEEPGVYQYVITATDEAQNSEDSGSQTFTVVEEVPQDLWWLWLLIAIIIILVVLIVVVLVLRKKKAEEVVPPAVVPEAVAEEEVAPEEIVEEEVPPEEEVVPEEGPPEEVAPEEEVVPEEVPPEEVSPEEVPPEEVPTEEAAPTGPISCPNCGTVNPAGSATCASCGSPL